ncbi:cytochrome P450 [Streptomyces libani subsp. rufus]|nr:cytochrome P450 [Streptomyces libani subsp. rufus]
MHQDQNETARTLLDPPQEWAELRQQCPVARMTLPSGDEAQLLTRYEDVKRVLSAPTATRMLTAPGAARLAASEANNVYASPVAKALDAEGHERWRRMVSKWFTAKRMQALRPQMEATAERLIDEMVVHGQPADLVSHLAFPLPVFVICTMLGVPESDREKFAHWTNAMFSTTKYSAAEVNAAQAEFAAYMSAHVDARRAEPGDDLISQLTLTTDAEGEPMSDAGLVATGQALLSAGHETTAGMIGKMVAMLLADRGRWERLLADRSLVRSAVEEVLRFDPIRGESSGMPRYLHEDVEITDRVLPRGTTVLCNTTAANRDESAFDNADEMDLGRAPNRHMTFGAGAHSCLGQSLARTELQTVLEVLLRRLPTLDLAVDVAELEKADGLLVGRLLELPVRWSA